MMVLCQIESLYYWYHIRHCENIVYLIKSHCFVCGLHGVVFRSKSESRAKFCCYSMLYYTDIMQWLKLVNMIGLQFIILTKYILPTHFSSFRLPLVTWSVKNHIMLYRIFINLKTTILPWNILFDATVLFMTCVEATKRDLISWSDKTPSFDLPGAHSKHDYSLLIKLCVIGFAKVYRYQRYEIHLRLMIHNIATSTYLSIWELSFLLRLYCKKNISAAMVMSW